MEEISKCPNCGREIEDDELYCYFCEADLTDFWKQKRKENNKRKN